MNYKSKPERVLYSVIMIAGILVLIWMITFYQLKISKATTIISVLLDPMIHHAVGEIMIVVPILLVVIAPYYFAYKAVFQKVAKLRYIILVGGLLNGRAWFFVQDTMEWHYWCLILWVISLVFFFSLSKIVRFLFASKDKEKMKSFNDDH